MKHFTTKWWNTSGPMEFISDRISMDRQGEGISIVIGSRLTKERRVLLMLWLLAWSLCGVAFLYEFLRGPGPEMRIPLLIMLAFWAYFELRIIRVVLWRRKGFELWLVKDGELTIKNSLYRFGKATSYFITNIQRLGLLNMDETSWKWQMSDSFWTRGAERLGFEYHEKKVAFGRGLTEDEARKVIHLLAAELKRERKAESKS